MLMFIFTWRAARARRLTPEEKMPHMEEWWSKSHELLVRAGVRESTVRTLVALGGLSLRENGAHTITATVPTTSA